jgi:hypothetical protein
MRIGPVGCGRTGGTVTRGLPRGGPEVAGYGLAATDAEAPGKRDGRSWRAL